MWTGARATPLVHVRRHRPGARRRSWVRRACCGPRPRPHDSVAAARRTAPGRRTPSSGLGRRSPRDAVRGGGGGEVPVGPGRGLASRPTGVSPLVRRNDDERRAARRGPTRERRVRATAASAPSMKARPLPRQLDRSERASGRSARRYGENRRFGTVLDLVANTCLNRGAHALHGTEYVVGGATRGARALPADAAREWHWRRGRRARGDEAAHHESVLSRARRRTPAILQHDVRRKRAAGAAPSASGPRRRRGPLRTGR